MKIRSIRVESFKRFREPLTLDSLTEGINLIAAPNGKGKSTLAEAVRVGFLERHRTASLGETLAPWSQPGANPSVQIEFLREGRRYRVAKTFGSRKSCTLEIEGGPPLSGEEAEQALADMFAFSHAAKGASRAEHQGVPGLLWVQQGTSGQIAAQVDHAHEYIRRALGDDLGELAATAGDRVIEQVAAELAVLHTRGGKPPASTSARSASSMPRGSAWCSCAPASRNTTAPSTASPSCARSMPRASASCPGRRCARRRSRRGSSCWPWSSWRPSASSWSCSSR